MNLSNFIARRYLFARKSLGVINIISVISASAIAIGCAALVVILSIYNGFDSIVRDLNDTYVPDVLILPAEGKTIDTGCEAFVSIASNPAVKAFCPVIEENVFIRNGDRTAVATAKGVDSLYASTTGLNDHMVDGSFELTFGEVNQIVLGRTLAFQLGANPAFIEPVEVYFPSRTADIDLLDPLSSLHKENLYTEGIVSLEQSFDQKYVFMPIRTLRNLLEYDTQATCAEIYLNQEGLDRKGFAKESITEEFERILSDRFIVKDKRQQNQMLYKLLKYEKLAIYLILIFVMIIISFNIFSSLSMLMIEKQDDVRILRSMGAEDKLVRSIFVREGWMISLLGIAAGLLLGLMVCFIQQKFGIVKMPGNFVVSAYPVVIKWTDTVAVVAGVGLVGYIISLLTKSVGERL
ncbi:MAG: ABC transporter permease [Bacteroidales bacterium]|nr:ABC transporter permease [Candidatus Cacconaster merdequi]